MTNIFNGILFFLDDFIYIYPLMMSFVWMIGGLLFFFRHEYKKNTVPPLNSFPPFSILVPCHNEERHIFDTIHQLMLLDYPEYEIIVIDDGSTDSTKDKIKQLCANYTVVRGIYLEKNQGKAAALNIGALASQYDLLLAIDADALLDPLALKWIAWHFVKFPRVGAVTGNPRVVNRTTLLAKIQVGEFSTIIGLIKRSQRILGKILTVSGVIVGFRKRAVFSSGGWSTDMATEDIDITWKLERHFWDIRYEPRALCWIYVPETLKGLWRQRLRWAQGGIEVLKKNVTIWQDVRQRRLWPIFIDSCVSIVWAYCFWIFAIIAMFGLIFTDSSLEHQFALPFPPLWAGSILALVCLMQFCISLYMDWTYEKNILKFLFWIIWYPFLYWMIGSLAVIFAAPKALFSKKKESAVWTSSDRGMYSTK